MGLISINGQTLALAAKVILSAVEGEHTLQCIVREKIVDLSEHRWGLQDYSWLVSGCHTILVGEPKLWSNLGRAWNMRKKSIRPRQPENWSQKKQIPLWTPHVIHKVVAQVGAKQVRQKELIDVGITVVGDILSLQGDIGTWDEIQSQIPNPKCILQKCLCQASGQYRLGKG